MKQLLVDLILISLIFTGCVNPSVTAAFPTIDIPSEYGGDCKNAAVYMHTYFDRQGYEVYLVVGNLERDNETLVECNHTWVMVLLHEPYWVAYDWGNPCFDEQHYFGYKVPIESLLTIIEKEARQ